MKKMFQIAMLKLKITLKDRGARVWMFLAPLIFIVVLVLGFGGGNSGSNNDVRYPVGIVNNDKGSYSTELIDLIKSDKAFEITEGTYEKSRNDVESGNTAMAVVIPENYSKTMEEGNKGEIEILKLQDNETTIAISAIVENYINQQRFSVSTGNAAVEVLSNMGKIKNEDKESIKDNVESSFMESSKSPKIGYDLQTVIHEKKPGLDGLSSTAIGILIMFIMYFVTGGAGSIFEEKEMGTWNRINSTPTNNLSILGGYLLGSFIIGWIQVGVLITVSEKVFNINWGNSPLGLVMLFSSYLLAIIGLGSALASFVKSKAQLSTLTALVVIPTSLMAGCMWPREIMPEIMLKISNFMPQAWVIKGMTDLVARGSDISAVYVPSLILLIFACVFFISGVNFMKLQNR